MISPDEPTRVPVRSLDMTSLKALAHPLRVRLLDVLSTYGPQTASGLAERLGESSGATSYHLRQLAQHDFIREVPGRGNARERWWERVPGGISLETRDLPPTAAARAANAIVSHEWHRNREMLLGDFVRRGDQEVSEAWIAASAVNTANVRVTSEQLADLTRELQRVTDEFVDRHRPQLKRPVPGSRPVQIQLSAFPVLDAEETTAEETTAEETTAEETKE